MAVPRATALLCALVLSSLVAASARAAEPTHRQQANRVCQAFYERTADVRPEQELLRTSLGRARSGAVRQLRLVARAADRNAERLGRVEHPTGVAGRWGRMRAAHRDAARRLRVRAGRLLRARTREAASARIQGAVASYQVAERRFVFHAGRLGLDGCRELDPVADLGRDATASPAVRAQAQAVAEPGFAFQAAVKQQAPAVVAGLERSLAFFTDRACSSAFVRAPIRARRRIQLLLGASQVAGTLGPLRAPFARLAEDVGRVAVTDAALAAGRAKLVAFATRAAALPVVPDFCASLRAWQQARWAPAAAPAVPFDAEVSLEELGLIGLGRRLTALGVAPRRTRRVLGFAITDALTAVDRDISASPRRPFEP